MSRPWSLTLALCAAALLAGCGSSGEDATTTTAGASAERPFDAATQTRLETTVDRARERFEIPGVIVGVWSGDRAWVEGIGEADVREKTPIETAMFSPIRSLTKSFTVTVILQLAEQDELSLDDTIGQYVKGISNGDEITLLELANMSSGVPEYTKQPAIRRALQRDPDRVWTNEELIEAAAEAGSNFEPGTDYEYSNTNTVLLGEVAERVAGKPLAALYDEMIFEPLGLAGTSYPEARGIPDPHPTGYQFDPESERNDVVTLNLTALGPSGGIVSKVTDLRRWAVALATGELLEPETQQLRVGDFRKPTNGPFYDAYGVGIGRTSGYLGHTGEGLGYQAAAFHEQQTDSTIVVLVNVTREDHLAERIFREIAADLRRDQG